MSTFRIVLGALTLATITLSSACGGDAANDCNDGVDNDGDDTIDGSDPGCEINGDRETPDPVYTACNNGLDDDGDGLIDLDDAGCDEARDDDEYDEPVAGCDNGVDDDGDGLVDFPEDPGCALPLDDDESDGCPDGADCPACANGADDDGDGDVDYPDDDGCNGAADDDEFNSTSGVCGIDVILQPLPADGAAAGMFEQDTASQLVSESCGGSGEEVVYVYEPSGPRSLVVTTDFPETTTDTVVYIRSTCSNDDTEVGCNDDEGLNVSTFAVDRIEAGTYYIIVDSHDTSVQGSYRLQVTSYTPEGEACDVAVADCAPGLVCRGDAGSETCQAPECRDGVDNDGDGLIDFPDEPGCLDTEDNDELDTCPDGVDCPQCSNGLDDDGDGFIDYPNDPGCLTASRDLEVDECIPGVLVAPLTDAGTTGTTPASGSDFTPSCHSSTSSSEDEYAYVNTRTLSSLSFSTVGSTGDTVLAVREGQCASIAAEVGCENGSPAGETVTVIDPLVDESYFVFVDGDFNSGIDYVLDVFGTLPDGAACDPADTQFTCDPAIGSVCSGGVCVPSQCNNGVDDDGDGLIDVGDPGCISMADDTEAPNPDPLPECADGIDNDGDTFIDYPDDLSCAAASDDNEALDCDLESDPVVDVVSSPITGDTSAATNDATPSCSSSSVAPEIVHQLTVPATLSSLSIDTNGSSYDTVLYLRTPSCDAADLACDDDDGDGTRSAISLSNVSAGDYYVFVDGYSSNADAYTLNVSGTIASGGACDPASTVFTCDTSLGLVCSGGVCAPSMCNNGLDDDGDGVADAADPGCATVADDSEAPDPNPLPACSDGIDNDGDGLIDYPADPGCKLASSDLEIDECIPGVLLTELTDAGTTGQTPSSSEGSDFTPTCHTSSLSTEDEYAYYNTRALSTLTFSTVGSTDNTVLNVRQGDCGDIADEVVCVNEDPDGEVANIPSPLQNTMYFVFVDGDFSSSVDYVLNVSGTYPDGAACDPLDTQFTCETANGSVCSAGVCTPSQCNNGIDDDGDGVADAADPGCETTLDDSESPDPNPLPECADGVDNDGDTWIDYPDDLGCATAGSIIEESCATESDALASFTAGTVTGDTSGATNDSTPSCQTNTTAPDIAYELYLPGDLDSLSIDTNGTGHDTVLYVRTPTCDVATDYACDDDSGASTQSLLDLTAVPAGLYYVYVDGYTTNAGPYTVNISGVISAGEACDPAQTYLSCAAGTTCTGGVCQ